MKTNLTSTFLMSIYKNDDFQFFIDAFNSCINQTILPNSITLVLDGPVNQSIEDFISKFKHNNIYLRICRIPFNVGLGSALNYGLSRVTEDIIIRMDSDDLSRNDRVQELLLFFQINPDIEMVGTFISEFKINPSNNFGIRTVPLSKNKILETLKFSSPFNHVSIAFRKEIISDLFYQEKFDRLEDYSTWYYLLIHKKISAVNIPKILVDVRIDKNFINRRRGFRLFSSWFKLYNIMYKEKFISRHIYYLNINIRFIQFVLTPKSILYLIYKYVRA